MRDLGRPQSRVRVPTVLSREEVARLLVAIGGARGVIARTLYGTGMRLLERVRLRTEDVDFDRSVIVVREGKGGKDRVVMLPEALRTPLKLQLAYAPQALEARSRRGRARRGVARRARGQVPAYTRVAALVPETNTHAVEVHAPSDAASAPAQPPPISARTTADRSHRFGTTSDE